jgi:hypothetical protein
MDCREVRVVFDRCGAAAPSSGLFFFLKKPLAIWKDTVDEERRLGVFEMPSLQDIVDLAGRSAGAMKGHKAERSTYKATFSEIPKL